jgi:hypothetical protein
MLLSKCKLNQLKKIKYYTKKAVDMMKTYYNIITISV